MDVFGGRDRLARRGQIDWRLRRELTEQQSVAQRPYTKVQICMEDGKQRLESTSKILTV